MLVTAPDEEVAQDLARRLVEARLVACANLVGGLRSLYRWQGEVVSDGEVLLLLKTRRESLEELARWVEREHPYETPEFLCLRTSEVGRAYAAWWSDSCKMAQEPGSPEGPA